jgi:hypothetical protein
MIVVKERHMLIYNIEIGLCGQNIDIIMSSIGTTFGRVCVITQKKQ